MNDYIQTTNELPKEGSLVVTLTTKPTDDGTMHHVMYAANFRDGKFFKYSTDEEFVPTKWKYPPNSKSSETTAVVDVDYLISQVTQELLLPRLRLGLIENLNIDYSEKFIKVSHKSNKETSAWHFDFLTSLFTEFGLDRLIFELKKLLEFDSSID